MKSQQATALGARSLLLLSAACVTGAWFREKLASVLADAQGDLNPHYVEAALFAFRSRFRRAQFLPMKLDSEKPSRPACCSLSIGVGLKYAIPCGRLTGYSCVCIHAYDSYPSERMVAYPFHGPERALSISQPMRRSSKLQVNRWQRYSQS